MILDKLDFSEEWGYVLNHIQEAAKHVLNEDEWEKYVKASNADLEATEDLDGILFNNHYFDWKQFDTKKREIVSAYLEYFTDEQLERIDKALGGKK